MSRRLRQILFWTHLVLGIAAGIVIAVMCFTGVVLAFEKEIIAWVEKDVRTVTPGTARLSLDELIARNPEIKPASITVFPDPNSAVQFSMGRTNNVYVNPFTAQVSAQSAPKLRAFMQSMIEWHRYLAQSGDARPRGKMITGACNFAFLLLAISGIYLWWPGKVFGLKLRGAGKARDWNWHNAIGFWAAPVLIVLTATALPFSYKWANDAIFKLSGSPAPGARTVSPSPRDKAGSLEKALETARNNFPNAQQITLRVGGGAVSGSVKDKSAGPRFATIQLSFDADGAITKKETYADSNAGRKIRSWTRFLHTGEAFGPVGQFVAGLASLGGLFLVWTGFALAIRRFFGRKSPVENARANQREMEAAPK